MASRVERYLAHLEQLSGGAEAEYLRVGAHDDGPDLSAIVYRDQPEPGLLTALTYGLSLGEHESWRLGRPELCISVRSDDAAWGLAIAHLASQLAGACPFQYGDTIDLGGPIVDGTRLSAFVVFAPSVLEREAYLDVLGAGEGAPPDQVINIAGMYPIHESERRYIRDEGLEAFWKQSWDPYDVQRQPAV